MLFDSHTHPYITFKKSPESVLEHFFLQCTGNKCICIGCDIESSQKSIALARIYSGLKATIGFHPCDIGYSLHHKPSSQSISTQQNSSQFFSFQEKMKLQIEENISDLRKLYLENKEHIVAIGEIGLDYYHLESLSESTGISQDTIKKVQNLYFRAQIQLAQELRLPFVIHSRESNTEVLEILTQEQAENYIFHCYSGDWDFAQKVLSQNPQALFGFGGPLTYKKSTALQEVAQKLSLKNILLETDAPFLTPEPFRGKEENEPLFISYVLKKLQELRDEISEEVEKAVYENAVRFFHISP